MKKGILLALMLSLAFSSAYAEEKQTVDTKAGAVTAKGQSVLDLALASDLAAYGRANQNPTALVVAAQIMKGVTSKDQPAVKQSVPENAAKVEAGPGKIITPDGLLAEAKVLAGDNLQLTALVDAEMKKKASTKGDVTGPNRYEGRVYPGYTDVFNVTFKGGEIALITVSGDGDNDLDLLIYDEYDNLIASDQDRTDQCLATFLPQKTRDFKIKVRNLGSRVYSDYILHTN